ncbi:MAG: TIGR00730 family Rossman fold protein [archaeon]|nr:TIGR00730 family Rossman fold protein [archaeon]
MTKNKIICVFCSSSEAISEIYRENSRKLGKLIAMEGWNLVYGGADVGLMGILSREVKKSGGKILGVIPEMMVGFGIQNKGDDEKIITKTMHERKSIMEEQANAFIVLPGGFGTLEEMMEVITLKQLGYHNKSIVILNINGFYDNLMIFFEKMFTEHFAKRQYTKLYHVTSDLNDAISYIKNYEAKIIPNKWFSK